ncbi:MAG: hypothetical protein A2Y10_20325 [Planctomycetes bacterium GWF2_41_51]|nr:MAG: hypothetical protein A2Y10_20325 [Planctomycetes bacterium GWF2_41_51]HBG25738.1 hypothetical protein [Phycisphaerales bacterium]
MSNLNTAGKIRLYKSFFTGLDNVYGTYDPDTGNVRQAKEPVTDEVILKHLKGIQPYGVYLLNGDKTKALAVDFDEDELALPIAFVAGAKRFGMFSYIERSKSKGFHAWLFFEEPVEAKKARIVAKKILADMGKPNTEIFPKQDRLDNLSYGNFINAPLFGKLVPKGRTVFVEPGEPVKVCEDQWELLHRIQRVPAIRLDAIIQSCGLKLNDTEVVSKETEPVDHNPPEHSFGLPPCIRRILSEGVTFDQRVCTFRLAIHLKKAGLPLDLTIVTLTAWVQKNKPADGKEIITEPEIKSQAEYAYKNGYKGCGCEEPVIEAFCDDSCPLASRKNGGLSK